MAAGEFYRGKNLRISLEGNTLFHATSCSLSIQSDVDEVATKDTAGKILIPGSYSGTISIENLLADLDAGNLTQVDQATLLGYQLNNTEISWEFSTGVSGDILISGTGFLTGSDLSAETEGIGSGSFSIQTTGDITLATVA
jgi:hypothetical protein